MRNLRRGSLGRAFLELTFIDPSRTVRRVMRSKPTPSTECCTRATRVRPADVKRFATLFKALGDSTRLEILALLAACPGRLCACDIEDRFHLSQPTISHHLRILREAGLINADRRGTWMHYALEPGALARVGECARLLTGKKP